jgi:hypothetical protein
MLTVKGNAPMGESKGGSFSKYKDPWLMTPKQKETRSLQHQDEGMARAKQMLEFMMTSKNRELDRQDRQVQNQDSREGERIKLTRDQFDKTASLEQNKQTADMDKFLKTIALTGGQSDRQFRSSEDQRRIENQFKYGIERGFLDKLKMAYATNGGSAMQALIDALFMD